jgi:hypothetical protein
MIWMPYGLFGVLERYRIAKRNLVFVGVTLKIEEEVMGLRTDYIVSKVSLVHLK